VISYMSYVLGEEKGFRMKVEGIGYGRGRPIWENVGMRKLTNE
jgi:hypothetical protein